MSEYTDCQTGANNGAVYRGPGPGNPFGSWIPCSQIIAENTPTPALQTPDTQPVVSQPVLSSAPATIVQPASSSQGIGPKIIIAVILVLLFGYLLARR